MYLTLILRLEEQLQEKDKLKTTQVSKATETATQDKEAESGLLGKLAALGLLLKAFGKQLWDLLKKKFFEYMGKLGTFLKTKLGELWKYLKTQLGRFGSWLWNSVKGAAKSIWEGLKRVGRNAWNSLKKAATRVTTTIGNLFKNIWNSKTFTALKGAIGSAFGRIGEVLSKAKNFVLEKAKSIGGGIARIAGQAFEKAGNAVRFVGGKVQQAGRFVVDKVIQPAKNAIKSVATGIAGGGGSSVGKFLTKLAKVPIIGPLIEGFLIKSDIDSYIKQGLVGKELETKVGERVISGVSAIGGSALGTIAGTGLLGPGVGSLIGAVGGDIAGRFIGGILADTIFKPNRQAIGQFALARYGGTPSAPMQDYVVENGKVYPFSSKDSVLGMKPGGAIDKLISSRETIQVENAAVFRDIKDIGIAQLQVLRTISDGIRALGAMSASQPQLAEVKFTQNELTRDYRTA